MEGLSATGQTLRNNKITPVRVRRLYFVNW
jgi:hypothetical protein